MAALLPFLALVIWSLALNSLRPDWGWGRAMVRSAVLLGCAAVVMTEMLSLAQAISQAAVQLAWSAGVVIGCGGLFLAARKGVQLTLPSIRPPQQWCGRLGVGAVELIVLLTGALAWIAPPNTWDSLNYHMARVAHWAQRQSVAHYPTGIEIQNSRAPGAEYLVLHLYVLAGSDR